MGVDVVTDSPIMGIGKDTKVNVPDWGDLDWTNGQISKIKDKIGDVNNNWVQSLENTILGKGYCDFNNKDISLAKTIFNHIYEFENFKKNSPTWEGVDNKLNQIKSEINSKLNEVIEKIDKGCLQNTLTKLINEHISKIDDECIKHKESIESSVKSAKDLNDAVNKKLGNIQNIVQGEVASFKEFVNKKVIEDLKSQKKELDYRYTQISKKSDELNSLNSEIESNLKDAFEKFNKEVELQKAEVKAALKSQQEELDKKHNQIVQTSEELKDLKVKMKLFFETKEKDLEVKLEKATKEFADYADFKSKTTNFISRLKWLFF